MFLEYYNNNYSKRLQKKNHFHCKDFSFLCCILIYNAFVFSKPMIFYSQILFLFCLTLIAAVSDIRTRRIPNKLVIPSFFIALLFVYFLPEADVAQHAYSLFVMIVLSIPLFSLGWMGGGDIKLLYVLAVSFPLFSFLQLFLCIAIAGGVHAVIQMMATKKKAMPYGLSIFLGYVVFAIVTLVNLAGHVLY